MIQRPLFALLAACSLFACGKVSNLGYGRDSTHGDDAGKGSALDSAAAGASSGGGAAGSLAGAGGRPTEPSCASAISLKGDLQVNDGNRTQLIREVTGNLEIDSTSSDLPQLRCLETVGGDLDVRVETGDLSVLSHLRSVKFHLTIHGNREMRDLSALSSLTSVGTSLTVADNDALVDLSGLENIDDLFELHLRNNAKLQNLDALSNLTTRGGDLEITGNGALVDLTGLHRLTKTNKLNISDSPLLHDLTGIDGVTAAPSGITIAGNDALLDLTALAGIESTTELTINDNPSLRNLSGLEHLASATSITLLNDVGLENIDALGSSLSSLSGFNLSGSPKLTNVEFLSNFTTLEGVSLDQSGVNTLHGLRNIEYLGALQIGAIKIKDFTGLGKATIGGFVYVSHASELESLSGLSPDTHTLQGMSFDDCPKLRDLAGLEMVQSVVLLTISANPQLESLTGLENLSKVERLTLTDSGLTNLTPLDHLSSIGDDAHIEGNPKLSACDIQAFVTRTGAATSTLQGNGPCN